MASLRALAAASAQKGLDVRKWMMGDAPGWHFSQQGHGGDQGKWKRAPVGYRL